MIMFIGMVTGIIRFKRRELKKADKVFKREFYRNGCRAHIAKEVYEDEKGARCVYTIRYRSNGYIIRSSSSDLAEAKRFFIGKTLPAEIDKYKLTLA